MVINKLNTEPTNNKLFLNKQFEEIEFKKIKDTTKVQCVYFVVIHLCNQSYKCYIHLVYKMIKLTTALDARTSTVCWYHSFPYRIVSRHISLNYQRKRETSSWKCSKRVPHNAKKVLGITWNCKYCSKTLYHYFCSITILVTRMCS